MRVRAWLAAVGVLLLSLLDFPVIRATAPAVDRGPLLPLDLAHGNGIVATYAALLVIVLVALLILRLRYMRGMRNAQIVAIAGIVLLFGRGVLATIGSRAPFDRARAARTVVKLRDLDAHLQNFVRIHSAPPSNLSELHLSPPELLDEWRHAFRYERHPDQQGYRIWSDGVPRQRPELEDFYARLSIAHPPAPPTPPKTSP